MEGSQEGESETELVISSTAQGPAIKEHDKDRLDMLLTDDSDNRGNHSKISSFIDCQHCRMEGNSLSYSCRSTGLHGTMRLSIIVCLDLYQWSSNLSCYGSSARHSEAQLRLAPNRPCMTLVKVFESQLLTEAQLRLAPNRPCMTL